MRQRSSRVERGWRNPAGPAIARLPIVAAQRYPRLCNNTPEACSPCPPLRRVNLPHLFSQRLRLHYVDWGNAEAPPLVLVHGGRDHCRNWDWVAEELRRDWHVIAPDLRGHGDSQWSQDGNYMMAGYVYDLAQLIHQQGLAPVTIIAHSLGGNVALRYAGLYPENVAKLVAIEGLGPSPRRLAERRRKPFPERMRDWIEEQRELSGRLPRRYASIEDAWSACRRRTSTSPRAGAPPHRARRQPERGRHLQLEVRQLRALLAALRHDACRRGGAVGAHHLPDAAGLRQGELGLQPGEDGRAKHFKNAGIVSFEGAGHWVHHDQLDEFMALTRKFFAER